MRLALPVVILLALSACRLVFEDTGPVDLDGDDVSSDVDCDDDDADVGAATTWYEDADGDGYGDPATSDEACVAPTGFVATATDCDDSDDDVHPGADETWYDGVDQDCGGGSDDDQDGDGVDSADHGGTDCDDTDPDLSAVADWYVDCDGDTLFDATPVTSCGAPEGGCAGDADPADSTTTDPGTYDCDDADVGSAATEAWYVDCDGDGFFASATVASCGTPGAVCPGGAVPSAAATTDPGTYDCADDPTAGGADAYPNKSLQPDDVADGLDNDCTGGEECYGDADGDGFGSDEELIANDDGDGVCNDPGESTTADDCDDTALTGAETYPGAAPLDEVDACMRDVDGDDWGDASPPVGVTAGTDCDDDLVDGADAYPGKVLDAEDIADGQDNDCTDGEECYADADGDTWGTSTVIDDDGDGTCDDKGEAARSGDCDDDETDGGDAYPGKVLDPEDVEDGQDNDCEGGEECFEDGDGDGFGSDAVVYVDDDGDGTCDDDGESATADDCDDDLVDGADAFPDKVLDPEDVEDGQDNDCEGGEECLEDADSDGFGTATFVDDDGDGTCDDAGESTTSDDCDDAPGSGANTFPGAAPNESASTACMRDDDGDDWGDETATGPVTAGTDCDDDPADGADAYPGKVLDAEDVADGQDNDCDDAWECFLDADDDGYGTDAGTIVDTATNDDCSDANHADNDTDCDDDDPTGATLEVWWIDCDGDGIHAIASAIACGSQGLCPGATDPAAATTTIPAALDCHDDDINDLYCQDCQEIYLSATNPVDGNWKIDGDGSANVDGDATDGDPFVVSCDFVSNGGANDGGWIVLSYEDGSGQTDGDELLFIGSSSTGNPWHKCADVAVDHFPDTSFNFDADPEPDGTTVSGTFTWTDPTGALVYDWSEEIEALTNLGLELWVDDGVEGIPTNHLLAMVGDDDSGDWENDEDGGHEVYVCTGTGTCDQNTGLLLTTGENGECGGATEAGGVCSTASDWPICGTESGWWHYHTSDAEQSFTGQSSTPAAAINGSGLTGGYVLPSKVYIVVDSGGGGALGWEYAEIRVR